MPAHYSTLCLFLLLIWSQYGSSKERERRYQLCGNVLNDMLSLICGGRFNGPDTTEQSKSRSLYRSLSRRSFIGMRRGVVDECCHSSCTLTTLSSYCLDPTSAMSPTLIDIITSENENQNTVSPKLESEEIVTDIDNPTVGVTSRPNLGTNQRNLTNLLIAQRAFRRFARFYLK